MLWPIANHLSRQKTIKQALVGALPHFNGHAQPDPVLDLATD